jgi:hypothetical protein
MRTKLPYKCLILPSSELFILGECCMLFTNPFMLFGFFALALPVLIHLFNFRRHKLLYFSNVDFLKSLQQQTRRTNKLKHLIVLFLRILMISSLVLAFARPYLPTANQLNPLADKLVVIYIDNSMSMQSRGTDASLFDEARQMATNLASSFQRNDLFVLLTNDMQADNERPLAIEDFILSVEKLEISPLSTPLSHISNRLKTIHDTEFRSERLVFYLSDFQEGQADFQNMAYDSSFRHYFVPMQSTYMNNLYIDSCWFESPVRQVGQSSTIVARIVNHGDKAMSNIPVRLLINGQQKAVTNIDILQGSVIETKLTFTNEQTGHFRGHISLIDYPVVFDDDMFFSFEIVEQVKALEVFGNQPNSWLKLLLGADGLFQFDSRPAMQLDYQSIAEYDIVFLQGLEMLPTGMERFLNSFVESGGSLLMIPTANASAAGKLNSFISGYDQSVDFKVDTSRTRVFSLLQEHELFQDVFINIPDNVDFPNVYQHYSIRLQGRSSGRSLIDMLNGRPFLTQTKKAKGNFYMLASPLNDKWTDLQRNALFVPLLYRMAFLSNNVAPVYYTFGNKISIETRYFQGNNEQAWVIRSLDGDFSFIPGQRNRAGRLELIPYDMVTTPGHYGLFAGDSLLQLLSWNYSRDESVLEFFSEDGIVDQVENIGFEHFEVFAGNELKQTDPLERVTKGAQLWKLFLIFALVFLLAESLVLRLWK